MIHVWKHIALQVALVAVSLAIVACSNSLEAEESTSFWTDDDIPIYLTDNDTSAGTSSSKTTTISSNSSAQRNYLPLNDTEYPYAGLPRIVIETENNRQILDRETKIPAKLQIYGKDAPETEITELTIKGRGNSSWLMMPKKSYKIKFKSKFSPLGMPANKDWALVSNYADKSLIKNSISYYLSELLEMEYTPKNQFVEFYLNREYLGVYLLTETVEFAKKRINESSSTYLVEFTEHSKSTDITITTQKGITLAIHEPKNATAAQLTILKNHLDSLETIFTNNNVTDNTIEQLFDINAYIKYYWVQEFSKNKDGAFLSSVYFTWNPGGKIKMGPLWDFDGAYGVNTYYNAKSPSGWLIRNYYWNEGLFKCEFFRNKVKDFWLKNSHLFQSTLDQINIYTDYISQSTKNNFKRWPILGQTSEVLHQYPYSSYNEAVDTLKNWTEERFIWINNNL